jgi:hypothetical protein
MGKTRKVEEPYLIITDPRMPGWEWRVLQAHTADPDKQYAAWFCSVSSPYTFGGADMGDTYIADVGSVITFRDPVVLDTDLPARLR